MPESPREHLKSWVESANEPGSDFPIQNLAYGVFEREDLGSIGVAIGESILDLRGCCERGLLDNLPAETVIACAEESLNGLMALGPAHWSALRTRITELLVAGSFEQSRVAPLLVPMAEAVMRLPAAIGDYTDFYASLYHATNVGRLFRPGDPLLPNFKYMPIAYHGRASSVVTSGTPVRRPCGQLQDRASGNIVFAPTRALDYELELGVLIGPGNRLGEPVPIGAAEAHVFGVCLLNDWSARDVQAWEYQPLGPFLSKNLATSISPWIIPMEALKPFRVPAFMRPASDPPLLPYLDSPENRERGGIDLIVEAYISTARMRAEGLAPFRLSRGNFRDHYWTIAQLIAHHTSNGCNLRPGDLLGSGTLSGPAADSLGCLLEITRRGTEPVRLPTGEQRRFLEDGDEVILRGFCEREGVRRIGLGECRGTVQAAMKADE
jgi:fumarylacetoacetase